MMKKKEHLPIFGIGPFLVAGMAVVAAAAIIVFYYGLKLGTLSGFLSPLRYAFSLDFAFSYKVLQVSSV